MKLWKDCKIPRWGLVLIGIAVLLVGAGVSRHLYLVWKERRLILSARVSLQREDYASVNAALERVLRLNPKNVEACRLSAQAMLKTGNAKALPWLRRVVELAPGRLEDELALTEAAWRFKFGYEAAKWVRTIEPKARGRADFHDLAGRVAESLGQLNEARREYEEALRLEPSNKTYRLRLSLVHLAAETGALKEQARKTLEELSAEPELKASALRALVLDAVRDVQPERARRLAEELDASPDHLFSDRLLYLQVLHAVNDPVFHRKLAETEAAAARTPEWILPLLTWMNSDHLAVLARDWVQQLPQESIAAVPIRMEIARSYAMYGDWKKLQFFLADEKWDDSDYLKQAYLARCYQERGDAAFRTTWSEAVNMAGSNGDFLLKLGLTARQWGWTAEAEETLWRAAMKSNKSVEALNALCPIYFEKRNADGLFRVYTLLLEHNPNDIVALNNFANISLMLDRETSRAMGIARDLYQKEPLNPVYVSTYAFGLFRTGQNRQALEAMEKLKPEELRSPSVAAYYSAFLEEAGRADQAREYRELARGTPLFPEERKWLKIPEPAPAPEPAAEEAAAAAPAGPNASPAPANAAPAVETPVPAATP